MAAHFLKLRERLASPPDWDEAKSLSQTALDDAAAFQAPGGGMTFFVPEDRYQSPYLSAYTALAFGWLQRSEEHTSELQSLMRTSNAVFCLKKKKQTSI